ncbi:CoA-binding protein [Hyalangium versicolor]|uniref:CoA-binding protein n=1 Tax=Hyalangium versicolor TaxID=2861190 RepID=UPI001CCF4401|nr:CoA-binding protein [Hyalangium versicolor]
MDWRANLVEDEAAVQDILRKSHRVAVLGIRPESHAHKPAHSVPQYLQAHGFEIIPVPTQEGAGDTILGRPTYRKVADVPGEVDIVEVFRRPEDIDAHVEDLLAKHPKVVWFQLGIRNDAAAERLARAGIRVVQDRCMKVEHGRLAHAQADSSHP